MEHKTSFTVTLCSRSSHLQHLHNYNNHYICIFVNFWGKCRVAWKNHSNHYFLVLSKGAGRPE